MIVKTLLCGIVQGFAASVILLMLIGTFPYNPVMLFMATFVILLYFFIAAVE